MPHSGTNNVSVSRYCRMNPCGRTISRSGPAAKKGTDADLAAHPQRICAERAQPCRSSCRRQKCKQQKPRFSFQCRVGKQLHKQRPVSQPIEHRKQKRSKTGPSAEKPIKEQKGRGRSKRKIFRSEKGWPQYVHLQRQTGRASFAGNNCSQSGCCFSQKSQKHAS